MLRALQARTVMLVSMAALFVAMVLLFMMSMLFLRVPQAEQPAPGDPEFGMVQLPSPDRNFATGFFTWILPGLMVGRAIASEIGRLGPEWSRGQAAYTAAGWALGFAIGGGIGMAARDLIYAPFLYSGNPEGRNLDLLMLLPDAVRGFFTGLVGAWFTLRGLPAETVSAQPV
jgi:hypothetical protein